MMRLFLFNPETTYDKEDIASRKHVASKIARKELALLLGVGLLKPKAFFKEVARTEKKRKRKIRVRSAGFVLNPDFRYRSALQELLVSTPLHFESISRKIGRAGNVKLLVLAGVFIQDWEGRIDLLVVGDRLKHTMLARSIAAIEADMGKELRYVVLSTHEFQYRLGVRDRLIRDIFDYPHQKVINRLGL